MTKVIILGEQAEQQKELKKIEFVQFLHPNKQLMSADIQPSYWANIELICRNYDYNTEGGYDLMYAYSDNRNNGVFYLGYFNDGVV